MKRIAIAAAALLATACGGSKHSGNPSIACNFAATSQCYAISGPSASLTTLGYTSASCTTGAGTVVGSCTATSRVGRCAYTDSTLASGAVSISVNYYSPAWTAITAQADCLAPPAGTWTPG